MAARIGRKVVFNWGGAEIPGVREKGISLNGEAINVTSDDDDGWQKLLEEAGENAIEIKLSGVTKSDALKEDWFAGTRTRTVTLTYPNGAVLSGTFFLGTYSETDSYKDASTFECTVSSNGQPTYTPYS